MCHGSIHSQWTRTLAQAPVIAFRNVAAWLLGLKPDIWHLYGLYPCRLDHSAHESIQCLIRWRVDLVPFVSPRSGAFHICDFFPIQIWHKCADFDPLFALHHGWLARRDRLCASVHSSDNVCWRSLALGFLHFPFILRDTWYSVLLN